MWEKVKKELLSSQQVADIIGIGRRSVQLRGDEAVASGVAVRLGTGRRLVWHKSCLKWFYGKSANTD